MTFFWISHRGNLFGPNPDKENHPDYITMTLSQGFHVEIDVWFLDNKWFLGHDEPQYEIDIEFLKNPKLWVHAKNHHALSELVAHHKKDIHFFSHDQDPVILTSNAIPWAYPGENIDNQTICVMPERVYGKYTQNELYNCLGICSDYIGWYKQKRYADKHIAVLISGRLKCHEECLLPQLRTFLIHNQEVWIDVFLAINDAKEKELEYTRMMDVPFISGINCENFECPESYLNHPRKNKETNAYNCLSMFYNNKKVFKMMTDFALENNINYDIVLKYRPDISNNPRLPLYKNVEIKENTIYIPDKYHWGGINDQIAFGDLESMQKYCNVFDDIYNQLDNDEKYRLHPETMLMMGLQKAMLDIIVFKYDYELHSQRF